MLDAKAQPAANLRTPDWYKSATRWTQLTLAEDDPVKFDPAFWIDVFKRTKSNATCLSAGGYIAYYPSKVPLHYVSKYHRRHRSVRHAGRRRPQARHARHGARRSARHPPGCRRRASRMDRGRQGRQQAAPLGLSRSLGDLRLWRLQLQVHARGASRRSPANTTSTRSSPIAGRATASAIATACRTQLQGRLGLRPAARRRSPRIRPGRPGPAWRRSVLTRLVVEWDDVMKAIKPHASFIPNMGGASLMEFDLDDDREALPVPLRRRPGPARHRAGLDGGPQRQAHARHLPRAPGDPHHLDRAGGGVSLEGFGHHRRRDPGLDRPTAPPRACCPGSPSSTASCRTSAGSSRWPTASACMPISSRCCRR